MNKIYWGIMLFILGVSVMLLGYLAGFYSRYYIEIEPTRESPVIISWGCDDEKLKIEQMTQIVDALTKKLEASYEVTEAPEPVVKEEKVVLDTKEQIQAYIVQQANEHGVPEWNALEIARCESGFRNVCNVQTCDNGRGPYQFLASTFDEQCEGDVDNAQDNIDCGIKLMKAGQYWRWKQSAHCHKVY
jgi:hypothetical protein